VRENQNKNKEVYISSTPQVSKRFCLITATSVFVIIGVVYLTTLLKLFPNLPVIMFNADAYSNYVEVYPPFRMDEINYYKITKNIINGNLYQKNSPEMDYPLGFPLIAVPFVAVWNELGGYLANVVIVICALVIFFLITLRYGSCLKACFMTIILAFASLNWFYAVSCYTEPLSQLLILLGFYFLTWEKTSRWQNTLLFCAGIMTGLNLFVRPHYILIALPFFLFYWVERKKEFLFHHRAFWYAGGVACIFFLWLIRNKIFFDGFMNFEYSRMVGSFTAGESVVHRGNFFWGLHRFLFNEQHGLFTITPILLLFPAGLQKMWKQGLKRESLILIVTVIIITVFLAGSPYPYTEFGLGSRHMMPIIPLILLPTLFLVNGTVISQGLVILLTVYSFYYAGLGWFTGRGEFLAEQDFFTGLLHDRVSRAIILTHKNLIPKKTFTSKQELLDTFTDAVKKCDFMELFQTLHPKTMENITGKEREFMYLLQRHKNPASLVLFIDEREGIVLKSPE